MIRNVKEDDYYYIYPRVNEWWGGRQLAHLLPKLFFQHFQNTSFVVEETDATSGTKIIIAFIIGFISQTDATRAYIHFVGVDPDHRKKQLGRKLYELFFETVRAKGVKTVNSITSLVNKTSIGFHKAVGFSCLGSAKSEDGIAYYPNYEDGKDCVVFEKHL